MSQIVDYVESIVEENIDGNVVVRFKKHLLPGEYDLIGLLGYADKPVAVDPEIRVMVNIIEFTDGNQLIDCRGARFTRDEAGPFNQLTLPTHDRLGQGVYYGGSINLDTGHISLSAVTVGPGMNEWPVFSGEITKVTLVVEGTLVQRK